MHVFVTGSTGFVGTSVVKELLSAGHSVVGLTCSDNSEAQLKSQGATALRGTIEDLNLLKKAAGEADGIIHLAFIYDFRDYAGAYATDRAVISALAEAVGTKKLLLITSGTGLIPAGVLGTKDDFDTSNPFLAIYGKSKTLVYNLAYNKNIRASIIRLAPTTYGNGLSGFIGFLIAAALNMLYQLALKKGVRGAVYHAVSKEQVPIKDIAEAIGKYIGMPAVSVPAEKIDEFFSHLGFAVRVNNKTSSSRTQRELGWKPTHGSVLDSVPATIEYMKAQAAKSG